MDYLDRPLGINDLETTGLNPRHCEIIEIGLLLINRSTLQIIRPFESKVKPTFQRIIEPEEEKNFDFRTLQKGEKVAFRRALEINGYNEEDWRDAPPLVEVLEEYVEITDGAVFSSHNTSFDWPFMDVALEESGVRHRMDYHRPDLFTKASEALIRRGILLPKYNLDSLAIYFNLGEEPKPHRALCGAQFAYEVFANVSRI